MNPSMPLKHARWGARSLLTLIWIQHVSAFDLKSLAFLTSVPYVFSDSTGPNLPSKFRRGSDSWRHWPTTDQLHKRTVKENIFVIWQDLQNFSSTIPFARMKRYVLKRVLVSLVVSLLRPNRICEYVWHSSSAPYITYNMKIRTRLFKAIYALTGLSFLTIPAKSIATSRPKFDWDEIKFVHVFGDSYSFVQGTEGLANFRWTVFWRKHTLVLTDVGSA